MLTLSHLPQLFCCATAHEGAHEGSCFYRVAWRAVGTTRRRALGNWDSDILTRMLVCSDTSAAEVGDERHTDSTTSPSHKTKTCRPTKLTKIRLINMFILSWTLECEKKKEPKMRQGISCMILTDKAGRNSYVLFEVQTRETVEVVLKMRMLLRVRLKLRIMLRPSVRSRSQFRLRLRERRSATLALDGTGSITGNTAGDAGAEDGNPKHKNTQGAKERRLRESGIQGASLLVCCAVEGLDRTRTTLYQAF
ncbi:hypothetical protein BDN70DRAFT_901832 [Pholiota conissans]|uniref:Uncharacterized protein n=1 Tax=Pholiota conissans TaxID=109636 RepID=A0A9P5YKX0_9AGAR|nr:hypothetical protein BDN70DRAFT_901832 [Pholiota conissans]